MTSSKVLALGTLQPVVDAYRTAGGVVEYLLIDASDEVDPHRSAATAAMAELARRHAAHAAEQAQTIRHRLHFSAIESEPERARGRQISTDQFIGRCYDATNRELVTTWSFDGHGNGSKPAAGGTDWLTDGYAEAFSDPPYPMRAALTKRSHWFNRINGDLFDGLDSDPEIWSWSTDWSTWFDEGNDWWGSFFWTIRPRSRPWMVVIAASTSD